MADRKDFLGRGWAWPPRIDPVTGQVALSEYEDDIREAIRLLLETAPGERVMRPDFGCGIHELVFEVIDTTTLQRVRTLVQDALERYEARVELLALDVNDDESMNGRLLIELEYRVRRTNQIGNLVFPFYFREGGAGA